MGRIGQARPHVEAAAELIDRARTSRAAFGELYDLYIDRVYRFCLAYTDTPEQAEDLSEETFTRALDALTRPSGRKGRYEDRGVSFSSWLLRIAANVVRDTWRRQREPTISLDRGASGDAYEAALGDRIVDWRLANPETQVEEWERAAQLRTCLALLPEDYQQVLRHRYWENRSWDDVAQRMGRSEGAVKKLGKRALTMLTVLLREDQLRAQLPLLPGDQQQAVRFRFLEGHDVASVAKLMGRTVGSVEWLLEGAIKTLWEGVRVDA